MVDEQSVVGGRYRIVTQIGQGGMSRVYLCVDATLNKQWAIKEIRDVDDPEKRKIIAHSLVAEANLIKGFDHPAIPRIVDLIEEHNSLFVVMDYIEGKTLRDVVQETGPQNEHDVVDWGIQLCGVLDYLHRRTPPIIYADMKPSNVMLKPGGTVVLFDFGIATPAYTSDITDDSRMEDAPRLGTPGYGSPEQFSGVHADVRWDVYSLGATLYYLLTGANPKDGMGPIRQHRPELSSGLEEIIDKAINQDPRKRYQNCAEFAYALRHYHEIDETHRKALTRKWRIFVALIIASSLCLVLGLTAFASEYFVRNNDYDYWMNQARQESNIGQSEEYYLKSSRTRPDSIEPYEGLISRYRDDGIFSRNEERQYTQAVRDNEPQLQKNPERWADLSYQTGIMYWFYYQGTTDPTKTDALQYERIRSASQWMHNAAEDEAYHSSASAKIYADIADFNTQIVPQISQGTDSGAYKPYFAQLSGLLNLAQKESNEIIRLNAAQFVQNAVMVYPRKFRAEGVSQRDMESLAERSHTLSETTHTTSDDSDKKQESIDGRFQETLESVQHAFVDSREVEQ